VTGRDRPASRRMQIGLSVFSDQGLRQLGIDTVVPTGSGKGRR
jgi:hypothetical protein